MAFKLVKEEQAPEKGFGEKLGRGAAQFAKGSIPVAAGIFGDVGKLVNDFIAAPLSEAITGKKSVPYEESLIGKAIPTTAQHKKVLEENIPYLKPENKMERFIDELGTDAASLFLGGPTKIAMGSKAIKAGSAALGSNLFGELVTDLTGDEKKGAYAKMGSMFTLSMLNKPGAQKAVSELYGKAAQNLPKDAQVNAGRLQQNLNNLKGRVLAGRKPSDLAPSEKFVVDQADRVLGSVQNGNMNVNTAIAAKRSLNEELQNIFNIAPSKQSRVRAKRLASEINQSLNQTLRDYGKSNPQWYKDFSAADKAFGTIAQSNYISNAISSHLAYHPVTHGLLHALGVTGGASGLVVPYQIVKLSHRFIASPALRKHYIGVLKSAAQEDATTMNKEVEKLDREIQKEDRTKKKKYKLVQP